MLDQEPYIRQATRIMPIDHKVQLSTAKAVEKSMINIVVNYLPLLDIVQGGYISSNVASIVVTPQPLSSYMPPDLKTWDKAGTDRSREGLVSSYLRSYILIEKLSICVTYGKPPLIF